MSKCPHCGGRASYIGGVGTGFGNAQVPITREIGICEGECKKGLRRTVGASEWELIPEGRCPWCGGNVKIKAATGFVPDITHEIGTCDVCGNDSSRNRADDSSEWGRWEPMGDFR